MKIRRDINNISDQLKNDFAAVCKVDYKNVEQKRGIYDFEFSAYTEIKKIEQNKFESDINEKEILIALEKYLSEITFKKQSINYKKKELATLEWQDYRLHERYSLKWCLKYDFRFVISYKKIFDKGAVRIVDSWVYYNEIRICSLNRCNYSRLRKSLIEKLPHHIIPKKLGLEKGLQDYVELYENRKKFNKFTFISNDVRKKVTLTKFQDKKKTERYELFAELKKEFA